MKRVFLIPLMIALMTALIFGGPALAQAQGKKMWTIKFHYEQPTTAPLPVYGFEPWAKDVERVTNSRVKMEIYPGDTLHCRRSIYVCMGFRPPI